MRRHKDRSIDVNNKSSVKYIGKCTEIDDIHELEVQIRNFIVVMKTKYGEDYKATSINDCIDALNRHLNQYSVIRQTDVPSLWQILDGKLKVITEQGGKE
ncbi:unnamed protein product [Rhizophagus irregularis]|uniref:Uncharacterized protein n=1 Tax=Rhizophagus irregularis TaxID=588596 RepID=A0A2I1H9E0_9GLOM|nr:hypothetical protein RhiirA4_474977 [Rhizophagus irregularis]CAB4431817.1 unnamed protein product [Rhizophagus irregularis]